MHEYPMNIIVQSNLHILLLDPLRSIPPSPCDPCIQINIVVCHRRLNTITALIHIPGKADEEITFHARML